MLLAEPARSDSVTEEVRPEARLAHCLQHMYSGERAASLAYRGHACSVRRPAERARIRQIECEERSHRARLREMMRELEVAPDPALERRKEIAGSFISSLCRIGGWFWPMLGAALFERRNVAEYRVAARWAGEAGRTDWGEELLVMAGHEREHERWFDAMARSHWLYRWISWCLPDEGRKSSTQTSN